MTVNWSLSESAVDDDRNSTGESEGMDTDEENLAPPGEEDEILGEGECGFLCCKITSLILSAPQLSVLNPIKPILQVFQTTSETNPLLIKNFRIYR